MYNKPGYVFHKLCLAIPDLRPFEFHVGLYLLSVLTKTWLYFMTFYSPVWGRQLCVSSTISLPVLYEVVVEISPIWSICNSWIFVCTNNCFSCSDDLTPHCWTYRCRDVSENGFKWHSHFISLQLEHSSNYFNRT